MESTLSLPIYKSELYKFKTWQVFLLLMALNLLMYFTLQNFIMTRQVYYSLLGDRMETYRIDDYISLMEKISLWSYIAIPLLLWLKIIIVSFLIQLPLMIKYIDVPFKSIFRAVTFAGLAATAGSIFKIGYLFFLPADKISQSTLEYNPLSITNFLEKTKFSNAAWGFLSSINAIEVLWIFIVYKGLSTIGKLEKDDSALLALGVWTFIAVFQFALATYLSKVF